MIDPVLAIYEAEMKGLPVAKSWHEKMKGRAEELCAGAEEWAAAHDCEISTAVETGSPVREILEYAREHEIEHIIMGSHGRSGYPGSFWAVSQNK